MFGIRNIYCLLLCFIFPYALKGQGVTESSVLQRYSLGIEQGLSNNDVNCIIQSKSGMVWMGTFDGLNRYDAYRFTVFRKNVMDLNSLPGNRIEALTEMHDGRLLIATLDTVVVFDPTWNTFSKLSYLHPTTKKHISLTGSAIFKAQGKNIFIGSDNKGLLINSQTDLLYKQVPLVLGGKRQWNYQVKGMDLDRQGTLWVFIAGVGLCQWDQESDALLVQDVRFQECNGLLSTPDGAIYLALNTGVYKWHPVKDKQHFVRFSKPVLHLFLSKNETIWASTDGDGIYLKLKQIDGFSKTYEAKDGSGLSSNAVKQVMEDREGRMWCATLRGGVTILDAKKRSFNVIVPKQLNPSLKSNFFVSTFFEESEQRIWVGTDGYGLFSWDRTTKTLLPVAESDLKDKSITKIWRDKKYRLWVSTWNNGIYRIENNGKQIKHYRCYDPVNKIWADNVWNIFEDRRGRIWATTFGHAGLYKWNEATSEFVFISNKFGNILTFWEDLRGDLWFGNDAQLIHYRLHDQRMITYDLGYRIRAIYGTEDSKNLWIGTEGRGILSINVHSGKFISYGEEQGLSNNNILNILPDDNGQLWLSTFNGLIKFDTKSKRSVNFKEEDGLQSNQFSYHAALKLRNSQMIFGGNKGFNVLRPENIAVTPLSFEPQLTAIQVNGKPIRDLIAKNTVSPDVNSFHKLELPYDNTNLHLEFSAFPFFSLENVRYAVQLIGHDPNWINLAELPVMDYNHLAPGNYKLLVRASAKDNNWKVTHLLDVTILPPWYQTWWSIMLYIALLMIMVYTYVTIKKNRTKLLYEAKFAKLEVEKEREIGRKKIATFADIIQEIKTPLTFIVNPLKAYIQKYREDVSEDLLVAYQNASKLLVLADQLSEIKKGNSFSKPLKLERFDFCLLLQEESFAYQQWSGHELVNFDLDIPLAELWIYGDRQKIALVIFNLLSFVFQRLKMEATVSVTLKEHDADFEVLIWGFTSLTKKTDASEQATLINLLEGSMDSELGVGLILTRDFVKEHLGGLSYKIGDDGETCMMLSLNKDRWYLRLHDMMWENQLLKHQLDEDVKMAANHIVPQHLSPLEIINKKTILVVDDNKVFRQYMRQIFKEDFHVFEGKDCQEAMRLIEKTNPNMVIAEVFMDGTGYQFCRDLKNNTKYTQLPIILISALSTTENQIQAIEAGADDFMAKPFDAEILIKRVHALMENRNALHDYFFKRITQRDEEGWTDENHGGISVEEKDFLEKCMTIIEENLQDHNFNAQVLASLCHMSYSNLYKKIRALSGLSTSAFVRAIRLRKAAELLSGSDLNINQIGVEVGIQDVKYFREKFKDLYGMTPSAYIKKYRAYFNQDYTLVKPLAENIKDRK